jgi:1,4-alpha-glucan branching enzyme
MGGEFGAFNEWYHETGLEWHLLDRPLQRGIQRWVSDLNRLYKEEPALHELDFDAAGFHWIDCNDSQQSALSMMRKGRSRQDTLIIACNFTPVPRQNYRVGARKAGFWSEILNSDARDYGGSGQGNLGGIEAAPISFHGLPFSLNLTLPPLGMVFMKRDGDGTDNRVGDAL